MSEVITPIYPPVVGNAIKILILCTGNSARSILLESIFNTKVSSRVTAHSAGSNPTGTVHPQTIALLRQNGHDTEELRSKSWEEFGGRDAPELNIIITVCGSAAAETCPRWQGAPVTTHWGVDDPAAVRKSEWRDAFHDTYDVLERRVDALLILPFEEMPAPDIKAELDRIGKIL